MKKFIILIAGGLCIAFAIALVDAEDTYQSKSKDTPTQACTNENGIVLVPTDTGFKECWTENSAKEQSDSTS